MKQITYYELTPEASHRAFGIQEVWKIEGKWPFRKGHVKSTLSSWQSWTKKRVGLFTFFFSHTWERHDRLTGIVKFE
jgi:hypothetical protein